MARRFRPEALVLAVALAATSATAEAGPRRGWMTGLGIGLVGTGVASLTLGLGFMLTVNESNALLLGYYPTPTSAPTQGEAAAVRIIEARRNSAQTAAYVSFGVGAATLAGGIACLLLDGRGPAVTVVPLPEGGAVAIALRW